MITTLEGVRWLRLHRFPTSPRSFLRVVRVGDHGLYAVDKRGKVYSTAHDGLLSQMRTSWLHTPIDALIRLGVATKAVMDEFVANRQRGDRREAARYEMKRDDLRELGVAFAAHQWAQLREIEHTGDLPKKRRGKAGAA